MNTMNALVRWSASMCALAVTSAALACPPGSEPSAADQPQPAQPASIPQTPVIEGVPEWMANLTPAPDSPEAKAYAKAQKTRLQTERELKQLRAKYFRQTKNVEARQVGFSKLREYTDPALFPTLIEIFGSEDADVRDALLDQFRDIRTDEADASLTWCAVFAKDRPMRVAAAKRVSERVQEAGKASYRVQSVIASGLKQPGDVPAIAAAQLASTLKLYDAIPMLINAQVTQSAGPSQAADGGESALAYILVGKQQAFVADLTPVVGDSAVGFDPTLGVITEGTVMRIIDAVVVTYRTEIHTALVNLSTAGWGGQSTAPLGWDNRAWRTWYATEFVPYRKNLAAKQ